MEWLIVAALVYVTSMMAGIYCDVAPSMAEPERKRFRRFVIVAIAGCWVVATITLLAKR